MCVVSSLLFFSTLTRVGLGRDLDGWAGQADAEPVVTLVSSCSERLRNCCVRNLKMDKTKKRLGGAEKQRLKKVEVSGGGGF